MPKIFFIIYLYIGKIYFTFILSNIKTMNDVTLKELDFILNTESGWFFYGVDINDCVIYANKKGEYLRQID